MNGHPAIAYMLAMDMLEERRKEARAHSRAKEARAHSRANPRLVGLSARSGIGRSAQNLSPRGTESPNVSRAV
jgi:hypothetical protein